MKKGWVLSSALVLTAGLFLLGCDNHREASNENQPAMALPFVEESSQPLYEEEDDVTAKQVVETWDKEESEQSL